MDLPRRDYKANRIEVVVDAKPTLVRRNICRQYALIYWVVNKLLWQDLTVVPAEEVASAVLRISIISICTTLTVCHSFGVMWRLSITGIDFSSSGQRYTNTDSKKFHGEEFLFLWWIVKKYFISVYKHVLVSHLTFINHKKESFVLFYFNCLTLTND